MYSTGLTTFSELQSAEGRLDTICTAYQSIYIFEFKIDGTAKAALQQIKKQKYAEPFLLGKKTVYLIGVNFVTKDKKINQIEVEKYENGVFIPLKGLFKPE
jgi:hypothetical protein